MSKKRVTVNIDTDLDIRWTKVAKRIKQSRSSMINEFLEHVLPILEAQTPNQMMSKAMKEMSNQIDLTASLFEDIEHDKSIEDYKEMKRG